MGEIQLTEKGIILYCVQTAIQIDPCFGGLINARTVPQDLFPSCACSLSALVPTALVPGAYTRRLFPLLFTPTIIMQIITNNIVGTDF